MYHSFLLMRLLNRQIHVSSVVFCLAIVKFVNDDENAHQKLYQVFSQYTNSVNWANWALKNYPVYAACNTFSPYQVRYCIFDTTLMSVCLPDWLFVNPLRHCSVKNTQSAEIMKAVRHLLLVAYLFRLCYYKDKAHAVCPPKNLMSEGFISTSKVRFIEVITDHSSSKRET
jgi:hypothetical protein